MKTYAADDLHGDLYYSMPDDARYVLLSDLIAAGALVPVADGEPCDIDEVAPESWIVTQKGNVYYREEDGYSYAAFSDSAKPRFLQSLTIVQPVRLTPIAEAVE